MLAEVRALQVMEGAGSGFRRSLQERQRRTRECILRAAEKEFLRLGYRAATMQGIARAAGVSKATVYAYFKGKEELLEELRSEACGDFALGFGGPGEESGEPLLQLEQAFDRCCEFIRRCDSLGLAAAPDAGAPPSTARLSPEAEALKRLSHIIGGGRERGVFRDLHPELAAHLLFKVFEGYVLFVERPDCPIGREEAEDVVFDFIRRGIMV